tara:strand:+ start:33 stop:2117 length:2085 start_codon:yes stop_codon:yes gene_type:complete
MKKNKYSSYWIDSDFFNPNTVHDDDNSKKSSDLMALSSYKRAVSNFVNIVTNKNIPVKFCTSGDSYTDGDTVTISSKINENDFDPIVGLALHEGSHIKLTDFHILKRLIRGEFEKPIDDIYVRTVRSKYKLHDWTDSIRYISGIVKNLLNVIEDRRIDNYIYTTSPGYKGYYHAMYEKYFHSKIIDKGLKSSEYRTDDWASYMFRIINITNSNRDLDALPKLRQIWNLIDIRNIGRLKNTTEAYTMACEIFKIVEDSLPTPESDDSQNKDQDQNQDQNQENEDGGNSEGSDNHSDDSKSGEGESKNDSDDGDYTDGDVEGEDSETNKTDGDSKRTPGNGELSPRQKKMLENAIKKQEKFQDGEITKKKVSKADNKKIDVLSNAGIESKMAGEGYEGDSYYGKNKKTSVIVVRKFTRQLVESDILDITTKYRWGIEQNEEAVSKGIQLGTMLGRRLKVRSEERSLTTPRMKSGKISPRLIHELGMGNTQIFDHTIINRHKPTLIHISIDASSSMSGTLWLNSQSSAVAIAKAASMTNNMDVVISYRGTKCDSRTVNPLVLIAYDSRVDKFSKIQQLFKHIRVSGCTPEGLCFEAIMDELATVNNNTDTFLINFSDGYPGFSNSDIDYGGQAAVEHTAKQVKKIVKSGVKVLSYFLHGEYSRGGGENFKRMYGKSAKDVDVTNLLQLTKTLNKLFE